MVRGLARGLARAARPSLLLAGALPFLPLVFSRLGGLAALGDAIQIWFSLQCHREAVRSFVVFSHQLPVCARCFGIYLGLGLGALLVRPRLSPVMLRLCVAFAVLVMLLDVLTEVLAMRPESAWLRLATGLLLSWPISAQLVLLARSHLNPNGNGGSLAR